MLLGARCGCCHASCAISSERIVWACAAYNGWLTVGASFPDLPRRRPRPMQSPLERLLPRVAWAAPQVAACQVAPRLCLCVSTRLAS